VAKAATVKTMCCPALSYRQLVSDCRLYGVDETLIRDGSIEDLVKLRDKAIRHLMGAPRGRR
jgi:hypothetical protein